jgi:hypothetical protein
VTLAFECRCDDLTGLGDADLIVAADGANSAIRARYSEQFAPTLDERPNLLAWYGPTRLFEPLSLIFRQHQDGLIIAHCYQYSGTHSTFLVEVPPETSHRAGLDRMSEAESLAYYEAAFAEDLHGHPSCRTAAPGSRYTIVKNVHWYFDNVVLLGDALRTVIRLSGPARDWRCRTPLRSPRLARALPGVSPTRSRNSGEFGGRGRARSSRPRSRVPMVREPWLEAPPRSDLVRLGLPAAQRPPQSRGNPEARPGAGVSVLLLRGPE